jgi:hypothetical protein
MKKFFESSEELCQYMAERNDQVILAFSTGKDSVGAWLILRKFFRRIVPYYCYLVPDLEFVERSLRYYEDFFETRIERLPHPSLYRMLNNLVFQAPENCHIIEEMELPNIDYEDLHQSIIGEHGLPEGTFVAQGVRMVDSLMRRISLKRYGPINERKRNFFAVFDWTKAKLIEEIRAAGVGLSVDYRLFGRSFDGIDFRFLKPVAEEYPEDYRRILEMFPLAELEIRRREYREKYWNPQ